MRKFMKREKMKKIVLISLLASFLINTLTGCDLATKALTSERMKIFSGKDTVVEVDYTSLKDKKDIENNNIVKVETYENLLKIFNDMELFYNESVYSNGRKASSTNDAGAAENDMEYKAIDSQESIINESEGEAYSTTNTQVENVDEADIIKTDGRYIYYMSNNQLRIIDTEGESPKLISNINLSNNEYDSYMNDMYITGDVLVVTGYKNSSFTGNNISLYGAKENSDSKIDWVEVYKSYTVFKIFNLSDRSAPVLSRTVEIEGNLVSSRLVGTKLYFVTNKWINMITFDDTYDYEILPVYKDTAVSNDYQLVEPDMISYFVGSRDSQYMLVGAFDVTLNEEVVPNGYIGSGSAIYMNTNSLYISKNIYNYNTDTDYDNKRVDWSSSFVNTEIYRFAVDGLNIDYKGSVVVPGTLINQYAMDEYKGILRVGSGYDNIGNGITNIDIETMSIAGSIQGLAKTEYIYSVRFMGDVGYMVTYRQTDPLFVFDLSDPMNPIVTGELKIPGFSQYLHPVGKNYLVGFGRNTSEIFYQDENGNYIPTGEVRNLGFKLSLFDISDMNNPKEVFVKIYSNDSYSEVSYNPKSIMVDASRNIFAFPLNRPDYSQNYYKDGNGGTVVQIDPEKGFITLADIENETYSYNSRFCYIGNKLYYIDDSAIIVMSYPDCKVIEKIKF